MPKDEILDGSEWKDVEPQAEVVLDGSTWTEVKKKTYRHQNQRVDPKLQYLQMDNQNQHQHQQS